VSIRLELIPAEFRQAMTPQLKRFYTMVFTSCLGTGLTLSMTTVYVHNVRHHSVAFATALMAAGAILGIVINPISGTLVDRLGPGVMIITSSLMASTGLTCLAFSKSAGQLTFSALFLSLFAGGGWGPGATLLSRLVPPELRQRAFGLNFMFVNLGIGFGTLFAALIVDIHHPSSFTILYLINAGVGLLSMSLFLTIRQFAKAVPEAHDPETAGEGWREVMQDKTFRTFLLCGVLLMIGGYGSQESGYSLYFVNNLNFSIHYIGLILFFNTVTIVASQLIILNKIQGRSRMKVLATVAALWASFWFVLGSVKGLPLGVALTMLVVSMMIFAVGEALLAPISGTLVNELAPEHLRGRYNSAQGFVWGVAGTLAPLITSLYFETGNSSIWPFATGGTALLGGALLLRLRRNLTPSQDGVAVSVG
jgi:MFS family permease